VIKGESRTWRDGEYFLVYAVSTQPGLTNCAGDDTGKNFIPPQLQVDLTNCNAVSRRARIKPAPSARLSAAESDVWDSGNLIQVPGRRRQVVDLTNCNAVSRRAHQARKVVGADRWLYGVWQQAVRCAALFINREPDSARSVGWCPYVPHVCQ
jgi:hypothetical protein